ncbi:MAG: cyclic pyranopterin monophosphate synthase MoaC [Phycisphaerales bacterium]|nr:cyclic pyranopterin monophosphate synthase MoaC [Phycisphaerales bacterium]
MSTPRGLSHVDGAGRASMVDVGGKPISERTAAAEAIVRISPELESAIRGHAIAKGNILDIARLAGIQAAKRTDELIPLCHSLPLDTVEVDALLEPGQVRLTARVRAHGRTGVEMEALTAASIAALTIIDMGKAIDRGMVVGGIRVLEKHGGRSGSYIAPPEPAP